MIVLIKLAYAVTLAALLILVVAFGIRAVYAPPQPPESRYYIQPPSPEEQQEYQQAWERHQDRLADYHRNVFLISAAIAVLAVAGGLSLKSRLDAIRLGLVGGGLSLFLYGVIQAGGDLDESGPELIFVVAAAGLTLLGAAGYRWLANIER